MWRAIPILVLLTVASFTLTPTVAAIPAPFEPVLSWGHNAGIINGSTITATFGLDGCVPGSTFSGTLKVTEPDGVGVATFSVTNVLCTTSVTNMTVIYPTGFTGTAGTSELGTYTSQWNTVISLSGFNYPTMSRPEFFTVALTTNYVPEFGAPTIMVAAMGLVLLAFMKKTRMLKV